MTADRQPIYEALDALSDVKFGVLISHLHEVNEANAAVGLQDQAVADATAGWVERFGGLAAESDAYQNALREVIDQFVRHRFAELARAYPDRLVLQIALQDWLNVRVGSATAPVDPRDLEHPEVAQRRADEGQPIRTGSFDLEHTP